MTEGFPPLLLYRFFSVRSAAGASDRMFVVIIWLASALLLKNLVYVLLLGKPY